MFQEVLLSQLSKALPNNTSLIDAVSIALDISYDAAHRRTSSKSKLSLTEGILLAKYYNLSLDILFGITEDNHVSVRKTQDITNEDELQLYFENSYNLLNKLFSQGENHILYSAKDIPIFYTLSDSLLTKFKYFTWLKMLDVNFNNIIFSDYSPKLEVIIAAKKLGKVYENLNITEIWDTTTINSTLKQIHYYYQSNIITVDTALSLCGELRALINTLFDKLNNPKENYKLYYNELFLMNNNVLVTTPTQQLLYVPFSILSYYATSDTITCEEAEVFMKKQLDGSKLLNSSGEKEQRNFFNKMNNKITSLKRLIEADQEFNYE